MRLTRHSSQTHKNAEYAALLKLGPTIIPLIVQKLTIPTETIAVHLCQSPSYTYYSHILTNPDNSLEPTLKATQEMPLSQQRTQILTHNNTRNIHFTNLTTQWHVHQDSPEVLFSSNSWVYASGAAYDALVALGASVIPNIMLQYAADSESQAGWWHLVLHYIVVPERTPYQSVSKIYQFRGWKGWFEGGGDMGSVPEIL